MDKIGKPQQSYLVYTCAGDHANIYQWLQGERNFDLWVNYYGDKRDKYADCADFYCAQKGKKFPNLHRIYRKWSQILQHYEAIIVIDDDIIMNGSKISQLFEIRSQYDLWLLQPAFHPRGKISHPITHLRPWNFLRYTNFVEVTCPLFRKDKLDEFMEVYDPTRLVGWGIDWWYLDVLGPKLADRVAIVDAISCINPHDKAKGPWREVDQPQYTKYNRTNQERMWTEFCEETPLMSLERGYKQYSSIRGGNHGGLSMSLIMSLSLLTLPVRLFMVYKWEKHLTGMRSSR